MTPKADTKRRLEILLMDVGKDARQIAREAGVDPKTIWELRRRKYTRGPRKSIIAKVAPVLRVSEDHLWALVCDVPYRKPQTPVPAPAAASA